MGAPEEDIWQIKAWTDAWVQRLGMMQTEDEAIWSTEMEIEAQHYFQPIFDRLRAEPDDTLLSDIVNTEVPGWGRKLNDNELHAEMMADTFVGGSETSTNALSAGVHAARRRSPRSWEQLCSDPDTYLPTLVEEVLRLEGPVQGLFRTTAKDVELARRHHPGRRGHQRALRGGQPRRARTSAARPTSTSTARTAAPTSPSAPAPTTASARRWPAASCTSASRPSSSASSRCGSSRARNDFRHQPNFCLRALKELHIGFKAR